MTSNLYDFWIFVHLTMIFEGINKIYTGKATLPLYSTMLSFFNNSTMLSFCSWFRLWTRAFEVPFSSHMAIIYPLESVKTNPEDSSIIAYKFSSPTGSQTFVLLSFNAYAGIALPFANLFRYSLASPPRFWPTFNAIKYCILIHIICIFYSSIYS